MPDANWCVAFVDVTRSLTYTAPRGGLCTALAPFDKTLRRVFKADHNLANWGGLSTTTWYLARDRHLDFNCLSFRQLPTVGNQQRFVAADANR